ncbi:DUF5822 domain-containing protein [Streptomyces sp. TE33382]
MWPHRAPFAFRVGACVWLFRCGQQRNRKWPEVRDGLGFQEVEERQHGQCCPAEAGP